MSVAQPQTTTTWTFDPAHSAVNFSAKHMMVTTVRGQFKEVNGTIHEDATNPAGSWVEVDIDAASVDTRNDQRDTHLRSADFLDVENFPRITFKSTGVDVLSADQFKVTGDLTVRGVTHPVTLETTLNGRGATPYGTEVVGLTLKGSISRKEWDLNWNVALEAGGVLVSDKVNIDIE
ncbi:MAG: YceI family protein, partial [Chloroflexota bacterium]